MIVRGELLLISSGGFFRWRKYLPTSRGLMQQTQKLFLRGRSPNGIGLASEQYLIAYFGTRCGMRWLHASFNVTTLQQLTRWAPNLHSGLTKPRRYGEECLAGWNSGLSGSRCCARWIK